MNYSFDKIAGYQAEKEELARLCEIFNNRQAYEAKGAKLPKGIIFYGEAGTGKTLFAKGMASVCNLNTITIDLGNADTDTAICKSIRKAFVSARKSKEPTMIFFDEIDKVMPNYAEKYVTDRSKTILAQLLTLIDGMDSSGKVVFVATCNYYGSLPDTLVRPGRIDKKISIGKPSFQSRVEILNMYVARSSCKFEMPMEELAKLSVGFSCAALETLINECILQSDAKGFVSSQLVKERIMEIKNEDISRCGVTMEDTITACSNIGSFIVARMFNDGDYVLNLDDYTTCNNYFNALVSEFNDSYDSDDDDETDDDEYDYCDDDEDDDDTSNCSYYTKLEYINTICVLMGKILAQKVALNKTFDNNGDVIQIIDDMLFAMSRRGLLGMNYVYLYRHDQNIGYSTEFRERLREQFETILIYCYNKAKSIVTANEELIRKLIPVLVEREMLDRNTLEPLLAELGGIKYVE